MVAVLADAAVRRFAHRRFIDIVAVLPHHDRRSEFTPELCGPTHIREGRLARISSEFCWIQHAPSRRQLEGFGFRASFLFGILFDESVHACPIRNPTLIIPSSHPLHPLLIPTYITLILLLTVFLPTVS
jgi:hypothetical protein